jgi:hypothetical protein
MRIRPALSPLILLLIIAACTSPQPGSPVPVPLAQETLQAESQAAGLTEPQFVTLSSLTLVDVYPLYTLHYSGSYGDTPVSYLPLENLKASSVCPAWACSLFAALGQPGGYLTGRNFDWRYSPALLLFTDPLDGYASVSMVDIAYLGFDGASASEIVNLPLADRAALLEAPWLPFDGMNEKGLFIGMAAVPPGDVPPDLAKPTVESLVIMRLVLDRAASVDEAVLIFEQYNVDMGGGPPLHYLVADVTGKAVVIEYARGEMRVFSNQEPWHAATNFLLAEPEPCGRYARLQDRLFKSGGKLDPTAAMHLLESVSQGGDYATQWSVVYELNAQQVTVVMGRQYEQTYTFSLDG